MLRAKAHRACFKHSPIISRLEMFLHLKLPVPAWVQSPQLLHVQTQVSHRHSKGVAELHPWDRYGSLNGEATFVFIFGLIHQLAQNTQAIVSKSEIVKYISGANQFEQRTLYLCRDYNAGSPMALVLTSVKSLIREAPSISHLYWVTWSSLAFTVMASRVGKAVQ